MDETDERVTFPPSVYICLFVSGDPISCGNSKQAELIVAKGNETRCAICFVQAGCFVTPFQAGPTPGPGNHRERDSPFLLWAARESRAATRGSNGSCRFDVTGRVIFEKEGRRITRNEEVTSKGLAL